jgi:flagellin
LSISDQATAQGAVDKLNLGIDFLSSKRSVLGAELNRMQHTLSGLRAYESNIRASESRIRDVDVAQEATVFAKYSILTQMSTAMLAQANSLPQGVLSLVG